MFGGEVFYPEKILDRHDIYDLESQKWLEGEPSPQKRHGAVSVTMGGKIMLIGGGARPAMATAISASKSLQTYSPDFDSNF